MLWHTVCIVCALISLVCALIEIDQRSGSDVLRYTAAGFLAVGCAILISDSFIQDHNKRRKVANGLQEKASPEVESYLREGQPDR